MKAKSNGRRVNLQQAVALLIQNEAAFLASQIEAAQRFARIEQDLEQIKAILLRHEQILSQLPEVIREKIGFKAK
jgi:tmRNA-binding protein